MPDDRPDTTTSAGTGDPVEIVAAVLADGRGAGADGKPRVGRQTRKKAQEVLAALRAAGWRVLR